MQMILKVLFNLKPSCLLKSFHCAALLLGLHHKTSRVDDGGCAAASGGEGGGGGGDRDQGGGDEVNDELGSTIDFGDVRATEMVKH